MALPANLKSRPTGIYLLRRSESPDGFTQPGDWRTFHSAQASPLSPLTVAKGTNPHPHHQENLRPNPEISSKKTSARGPKPFLVGDLG
jgi:hypothetical protein